MEFLSTVAHRIFTVDRTISNPFSLIYLKGIPPLNIGLFLIGLILVLLRGKSSSSTRQSTHNPKGLL